MIQPIKTTHSSSAIIFLQHLLEVDQHDIYKDTPQPSYDPNTPPDSSSYIAAINALYEDFKSDDPAVRAAAIAARDRLNADTHASGYFDHSNAFTAAVLDLVATIDDDYAAAGAACCDGHDNDWK
jgi:hypothetical protein